MSGFRTGSFDRERALGVVRPFTPARAARSLLDVDLDQLAAEGKRLILLDVDHTIIKWGEEDFPPGIMDWVQRAREKGLDLCILSNTRKRERLARLSEKLGVPTVEGKFKPSRVMYRLAMIKFQRKASETVMIGDQLFTDVLGANRCGIDAIWVQKMEGREFAGTKVSRVGEAILRSALYKALITPVDETPAAHEIEVQKPVADRTLLHQILKFCVVGGSSFVIDTGLTFLFVRKLTWGHDLLSTALGTWLVSNFPAVFGYAKTPSIAAIPILGGLAALVAMFNSFVWNRSWTFRVRSKEERLAQLRRFYAISIVGAVLNTAITSLMSNVIVGHPNRSLLVAKVIAAAMVAVWNFMGQRFYAFKGAS